MIPYIGRFAPSPSGPLHSGSLACAIASFIDAKANNGIWKIRIEDIDPPREIPGIAQHQVDTLRLFGMESDTPILYQSQRSEAYQNALEFLLKNDMAFACSCSRKTIEQDCQRLHLPSNVYPGTCRNKKLPLGSNSVRFKVPNKTISFEDRWFGPQKQNLETECGDFVLKRANGLWAYQLAVVVDDAFQNMTHIVRGADLLDNTPRQIALQEALGFPTPIYLHIPLVLNPEGQKLSKQNGAKELDLSEPEAELEKAWIHLGFKPFVFSSIEDFYNKAIDSWRKSSYY